MRAALLFISLSCACLWADDLPALQDGALFALGSGEVFAGKVGLPPVNKESPRVTDMNSEVPWSADANRRIWFIRPDAHETLSEWDGEQWHDRPIPGPARQRQMPPYIVSDSEGRLWLEDESGGGEVDILDPKTAQWQSFAQREDAYLQLKSAPPHFLTNAHYIFSPAYSPDGKRLAFRRSVNEILYYDGGGWRRIDRRQITGKTDDNAIGPPWFASDGNLCVNLRPKTTWKFDGTAKWTETAFESHFPADIWSEDMEDRGRPPVPEGCVTRNPDSIVKDNLDTCWLTWKGQLYRAIPHFCVPVFSPGEPNPFSSIHDLREVHIDGRGDALIEAAGYRMDWFIVRPRLPIPQTVIGLQRTAPDSFTAHLDAKTTAPVTFRWQLDDDEWQLGAETDLAFNHLPNGVHTLHVSAVTPDLDFQASPTSASFETKIDAAEQIAGLIAQLGDSDYARRKSAVSELARQPGLAVPALKKARARVNADEEWWIDVALQEAQRQRLHPADSKR